MRANMYTAICPDCKAIHSILVKDIPHTFNGYIRCACNKMHPAILCSKCKEKLSNTIKWYTMATSFMIK